MPPKRKVSEVEKGKSDGIKEESKPKKSASSKKSAAKVEEETPKLKSVTLKGKAPVDPDCPQASSHHVFSEGDDIWDAMLNQTNIDEKNNKNNNKFYIIQLLEGDLGQGYGVWMRWGRVGYSGQKSWQPSATLEGARETFVRKFMDKTKNRWEERKSFEKKAGYYDLVAVDYCQQEASSVVKEEGPLPDSTLPKPVQELVKLVCSLQTMEKAVIEMQFDTRKAPLGKLTKEQIKAGFSALQSVAACVERGLVEGDELTEACNNFYTRIPHACGMKRPPLLTTKAEVKEKIQLLEALQDIEVGLKLLGGARDGGSLVDQNYNRLQINIAPVPVGPMRSLVERSILSTHADTHSQYNMVMEELFSLEKPSETTNFLDCGNRQLLFHGSRLSNWAGILGQGLRIAPPEAPVTGYMFGKGVYFADMSSKAANYCFPSRSQPYGLLLVCEVSKGVARELVAADSRADKLPKGLKSVSGLGRVAPSQVEKLPGSDDLFLPMGPAKNTKVAKLKGYTLNYNEFIVYDTRQIKMKFLAKIRFDFKQ